MTLKREEIAYYLILLFILYVSSYLANILMIGSGPLRLVYGTFFLILVSIFCNFVWFLLEKFYFYKKSFYENCITLSFMIHIFFIIMIAGTAFIFGSPNYGSFEVRDSETNELIKNVSLQFVEWKVLDSPCKKNITLKDGKISKFDFFSFGFSTYFTDTRYYKDYQDHAFFANETIFLTKKGAIEDLPGNYDESWNLKRDDFIGCRNSTNVGFDFSSGKTVNAEEADIILDSQCKGLNFKNYSEMDYNTDIIAVGSAEIMVDKRSGGFFGLKKAPEKGFKKRVGTYEGNKYIVKTRKGNYAKFYFTYRRMHIFNNTYLPKFEIIWVYQPDGSRNLATEDYSEYTIDQMGRMC